jgi:hypothetical protein
MSIVNKIQTMQHIDVTGICPRVQFAVGDKLLHEIMLVLVPLKVQIKEDLKNVQND